MEKHALIISTVSGFLLKFESDNVSILQDLGYIVHYASNFNEQFYHFRPEELEERGIRVHHIDVARSPYQLRTNAVALRQVLDIIRTYDIRLIHCHEPMGGVLGRLAAAVQNDPRIKVIYTAHGFHFYKGAPLINNTLYYAAERILAHYTDALLLINGEDLARSRKLKLRSGGIVRLIPGVGLDMDSYYEADAAAFRAFRQSYGIADDAFFLLSVGELNENKNHLVVLKALKSLRDRGLLPQELVYGICGEGFLHQKLEQWCRELGLSEHVCLYGYCVDVRPYICMSNASIFPSKREGLGMAALESLSMGRPVIASDNRGTREYMRPGENGYLCRWDDPESFAEMILRLHRMSAQEYEALCRACRPSVTHFSRRTTHQIMTSVYMELDRKVCEE